MRLFLTIAVAVGAIVVAAQQSLPTNDSKTSSCMATAKRAFGPAAKVLRVGDLSGDGRVECLAVDPYPRQLGLDILVKRGGIFREESGRWRNVLSIDSTVRNERGYIGIDFIDGSYTRGFQIRLSDERTDGSKAFTLLLSFLDPHMRPEGLPIEVSWNAKVHRFQEYAPNELDPPGFKPEVAHPPIRNR